MRTMKWIVALALLAGMLAVAVLLFGRPAPPATPAQAGGDPEPAATAAPAVQRVVFTDLGIT